VTSEVGSPSTQILERGSVKSNGKGVLTKAPHWILASVRGDKSETGFLLSALVPQTGLLGTATHAMLAWASPGLCGKVDTGPDPTLVTPDGTN
jgi:hypothetical protein